MMTDEQFQVIKERYLLRQEQKNAEQARVKQAVHSMLKRKKLAPINKQRQIHADMTIEEIMPKGLGQDQFAGLDDDDILM